MTKLQGMKIALRRHQDSLEYAKKVLQQRKAQQQADEYAFDDLRKELKLAGVLDYRDDLKMWLVVDRNSPRLKNYDSWVNKIQSGRADVYRTKQIVQGRRSNIERLREDIQKEKDVLVEKAS